MNNPFSKGEPDRHAIWDMLVARDIAAFAAADWALVAADFDADAFVGTDAAQCWQPDAWRIKYPSVNSYRAAWEAEARALGQKHAEPDLGVALHRLTSLADIEIVGDRAMAHKKLEGAIALKDGSSRKLSWQTLYSCRKQEGVWRITGFIGYLPNDKNKKASSGRSNAAKELPASASLHKTAGPYSPVLVVDPGKLVVICGQAALNEEGEVVGDTIEAQTRLTLENCFRQLASAGCGPEDVFKVNIFMTDLDEWPRLNAVYREMMVEPFPVRTAVQAGLLLTLKVEIEMWAVRS